MGQPVTTNPILIALINMTVVFAVLYGLSLVIRLIRLVDPTQKKNIAKIEPPAPAAAAVITAAPEAAGGPEEAQVIAVIAAAIAAYGYSPAQIASIRRISGGEGWTQAARLAVVNTRNQMF